MSVVLVSNDIHQTQISKRKRTCCVVKIVNHTPPSYAQSRLTRLISTRSHIMHANNLGPITHHGKPQLLVGVSVRFTQRSVHPTAVCPAKSIHPKGICHYLSLKKGNNHGKTVTAYVESKGN